MSAPRRDVGDGGITISQVDNGVAGLQTNSVDVADPDSEFGWGNRFEFGHQNEDTGWEIGILGNLNAGSSILYGDIDFIDDPVIDADGDGQPDPIVDANGDGIDDNLALNDLISSVNVLFRTERKSSLMRTETGSLTISTVTGS